MNKNIDHLRYIKCGAKEGCQVFCVKKWVGLYIVQFIVLKHYVYSVSNFRPIIKKQITEIML